MSLTEKKGLHLIVFIISFSPLLRIPVEKRTKLRKLFKDTHREKAPSNKTPTSSKSIWTCGYLVHQINSLYDALKRKQIFEKIK